MSYFDKLLLLYELEFLLVSKTPIRIGAGKGGGTPLEIDLPVVRNASGTPIIPGSSLKGFFKANFERVIKELGIDTNIIVSRIFGIAGKERKHASSVFFTDAIPVKESSILVRKHIQIDPETGGVMHGPFDVECISEGWEFEGKIVVRNLPPSYLTFIPTVTSLTNLGFARIGGFKSRGYGSININVKNLKIIPIGWTRNKEFRSSMYVDGEEVEVVLNSIAQDEYQIKEYIKREKIQEDILSIKFKAEITERPEIFSSELKVRNVEEFIKDLPLGFVRYFKRE